MKSFATKLFAVIFILMLAAGCASSITAPQDLETEEPTTQVDAPKPDGITTGGDMRGNRERPEL